MRTFVAGGTGVIGRRVVARLVDAGHDVTAVARSEEKASLLRELGAVPVAVSLFDVEGLRLVVAGSDVVVNLATHVPGLLRAGNPRAWAENDRLRIEGSKCLVDASTGVAGRFIQESLGFAYGEHGSAWIDESLPVLDTPFTKGIGPCERSAARFTSGGGEGVVLRFGQFYASDASHTRGMVKAAKLGWALMPNRPDAFLSIVHADDAAAAVVAALTISAGVYNVVDDDPVTQAEWCEAMATAVKRRKLRCMPAAFAKIAGKKAPHMIASQRVSNQKFKTISGWSPAFPSFRDGAPTLGIRTD